MKLATAVFLAAFVLAPTVWGAYVRCAHCRDVTAIESHHFGQQLVLCGHPASNGPCPFMIIRKVVACGSGECGLPPHGVKFSGAADTRHRHCSHVNWYPLDNNGNYLQLPAPPAAPSSSSQRQAAPASHKPTYTYHEWI
ncbi:hypothetical protein PTTG_28329 [Puccinia triticina 1-1 BBBD Race 1]|uniref:Secreted protein n=1 Tax=Puccinia triticina (isolate 1-1 / race 1 (BBBD)) TaxID=630390 RepID=A0A180GEU1_PUCT1|nr:hypothetical protein PTTG_28329 [Puccinia triticina 1-1 BBBD Race 1]